MKEKKFLKILEKEASSQSQLQRTQLLPKNFKPLASFFVEKFWKIILVVSAVLAFWRVYYETKTI